MKKEFKSSGVITSQRKPDGSKEEVEEDHGLEAIAQDFLHGIETKNEKMIIAALRAAFEIFDSEPHKEGPHENDFESQNELAAKESR